MQIIAQAQYWTAEVDHLLSWHFEVWKTEMERLVLML